MLALAVCCLSALAQDVLVKKDGSSLLGRVEEVTETEVKYRKADNPNGPLYTIKVADLMRINYENGQSDVFSQDGMTPGSILPGATGDVKDTELLKMYNQKEIGYINPSLPKKLKLIGFIGGGTLIATGTVLMIVGMNNHNTYDGDGSGMAIFVTGSVVCATGIAGMTSLYFIAKHKQKQIDELACTPLFRQQLFAAGGKSLSMGVDYIGDRFKTRTLGVGMTFNF